MDKREKRIAKKLRAQRGNDLTDEEYAREKEERKRKNAETKKYRKYVWIVIPMSDVLRAVGTTAIVWRILNFLHCC